MLYFKLTILSQGGSTTNKFITTLGELKQIEVQGGI